LEQKAPVSQLFDQGREGREKGYNQADSKKGEEKQKSIFRIFFITGHFQTTLPGSKGGIQEKRENSLQKRARKSRGRADCLPKLGAARRKAIDNYKKTGRKIENGAF